AMAGRATLTTVPSRNTAPEPSTEPATSQRPGAVFSRTGASPPADAAARRGSAPAMFSCLPRDRLPVVVETAARPAIRQRGTPDDGIGPLLQRARGRWPAHVAPHPAGIHRVH